MDDRTPVLLIERLSVVTLMAALIASLRSRQVFFVHESWTVRRFLLPLVDRLSGQGIRKLNNVDFLGLYYDYMEQACSFVNDAILGRHADNRYFHVALEFCGNEEYRTVIEKELLNRYVAPRVKTIAIVKRLAEEYREISFLPADNEDIASAFSPPLPLGDLCRVPRWASAINAIRQACLDAAGMVLFPALLAGLCLKIVQKGIVLGSPERKEYTYGIDMQRNGLIGERGLDTVTNRFFLYDDHDFAPEKILHVVRNGHRLEEEAREVFIRHTCPFIELDSLNVPVSYLARRVIRDLLLRGSITCLGSCIGRSRSSCGIMPALSTMKMTMDEEINCLYYGVRVFIARDDYSPFHIVRTLVAHAAGNRTIGFQWADYYYHNSSFSHFVFDRYALFGEFYQEFHAKGLAKTRPAIIGAGIYGSDTVFRLKERGYYPENYRKIKERYRIVAIMGSAFEDETSITRGPAIRFHEEVLEATDGYPGIFRVLKPKGDYLDAELREMMERHADVYLEKELPTPRFLLVPDLIIVQSNSTIGIEALMAGRRVLYYSFVTPPAYQIYSHYGMPLVAFTAAELKICLDRILNEDTYLDEAVVGEIQTRYGYKFDGNVAARFRMLCRDLADPGDRPAPASGR